ncbi:MAG TPA: hypothetical protein VL134_00460 [Leptolyngbya sp.]|jgi:hypothetical protein|nr:hypothetical protein [Leptolyngbya sp.]
MSKVTFENQATVENTVISEPPSPWKVPDIVVLLLMPIALLLALIVSLVSLAAPRQDRCCKDQSQR